MAAGPADKSLDTFKTLVFDPIVKVLIEKVIGLAGWMSWGPISFVITKAISWVADRLYDEMGHVINFQVIMIQNEIHHKAYVSASLDLKGIAKDKGVDSEEFKKQRERHRMALSKFVRYSGT